MSCCWSECIIIGVGVMLGWMEHLLGLLLGTGVARPRFWGRELAAACACLTIAAFWLGSRTLSYG